MKEENTVLDIRRYVSKSHVLFHAFNLGIKRIVDFRSTTEKTEDPDIIPGGISYVEMPIEVDGAIRTQIEGILKGETEGDVKNFLIEANKEFITDYKDVYSKFLKDLICL